MSTQAEAERIAQEKADAEAKEKEEADRIAAEKVGGLCRNQPLSLVTCCGDFRQPERHRADAGLEATSRRWREVCTPSSRCSHGDI